MYSPNSKTFKIDNLIGGLNVTKPPTEINDNQTPDAQNWINNELIGINSRYGYTKYYTTALGTANINRIFVYNQYTSSDFIFSYGTSLVIDKVSATSLLYSGMTSGTVRSFEMGGNMYFLDGSGYIQYDGTNASAVSGYVPTYYINKEPDGTEGTKLDELNYIQSAFTETFNGDGTSTSFYLTYGSLTTQTPTVVADDVTCTLSAATAGFTVNYASGVISLTTAAVTGVGNVEITAYKEVYEASQITKCTFCETYGEGNDTFVFMSGNSSYPARIYWSDTSDPTYFPATSYADVGVTNDKMMGFIPFDGGLQLWKYRSVHRFNGTPPDHSITELYVNNEGCIATDTLRLINGYPGCLSQRGIVQLITGQLNLISEDINGREGIRNGLLTETAADKAAAFSYEFDNKYWLYIDDEFYILQYDLIHQEQGKIVYPWLKWTDITAKCLMTKDNYLYFGGAGNIYKFDPSSITDDGSAIDSYFYSKKIQIEDTFDWIKWFLYIYFNFNIRYGNSAVTVSVYVDDEEIIASSALTVPAYWDPNDFNPNDFNPNGVETNAELRVSLHRKGRFIQFKVRCNTLNNAFTLYSARMDYIKERKG